MENQHRHIRGYRELNEQDVRQINAIKMLGDTCGAMIETLAAEDAYDQRWVSLARTQLQQGFMAAIRAVAQPSTF